MRNISLGIYIATLSLLGCQKDTGFPDKTYPPLVDPPPPFVTIFEPGDTSKGAAYANKMAAKWSADTYCKKSFFDSTKLQITFFTYAPDGSRREGLGFGLFSSSAPNTYIPIRSSNALPLHHQVTSGYGTWVFDGDVIEDSYLIDTTNSENHLTITKIDLANKRIEGTFHVMYQLQEPRQNPANLKTVTFSSGRFWAIIRD